MPIIDNDTTVVATGTYAMHNFGTPTFYLITGDGTRFVVNTVTTNPDSSMTLTRISTTEWYDLDLATREAKQHARQQAFRAELQRVVFSSSCAFCNEHRQDKTMPPHEASIRCQSGRYDHCTCDICY